MILKKDPIMDYQNGLSLPSIKKFKMKRNHIKLWLKTPKMDG